MTILQIIGTIFVFLVAVIAISSRAGKFLKDVDNSSRITEDK